MQYRERLRLHAAVAEGERMPTVTGVWPGADWFEREVYDLFGVQFEGHPNLVRILMPDDYPDHPLRKDFDVEGGDSGVEIGGRPVSGGFRDLEHS